MLTLVTGTTGQVGRRFVPRLLAQRQPGEHVRVLVRDEARGARFAELGAQVAVGDLRDEETLGTVLAGVDAVVNVAAAFRGVPEEEMWAVNRDAAVALGRAAQKAGVARFVQVSTNNVYGTGRGRPLVEDDESRPGGPLWGAYPASKLEAERALLATEGLDVRIARLPFVYGEGDPHLRNVMAWAPRWAPQQRLHMARHADVAQALMRLLYAPGIAGRIYNVGDDAPVTTVELYRLNGMEVPDELYDNTDPDPWHTIVDTRRIRRELGFRPIHPSVYTAREAGAL